MKTLRFNAPSHHRLFPEGRDGPVVYGGETFTHEDVLPHCEEVVTGLSHYTRLELNELAEQSGIDDPAALPDKAAVIAAINNEQEESANG